MRHFFFSFIALFIVSAGSTAIAQNQCTEIFSKQQGAVVVETEVSERLLDSAVDIFSEALTKDPYMRQQLIYIENQLRDLKINNSPVNISRKNKDFRKEILPLLLGEGNYREATVRVMEADLRFRSQILANKLKTGVREKYDVVIVGAGVHGTIALQSLLRTKPNLKILVIEETDTAGATFRYPNDSFRINSSNRPSSEETLPLPGQGNINELPQLPIQVSDLSAAKYPTAGDLGTALVAGLYAAANSNKNVDVLFSSSLSKIGPEAFAQNRGEFFGVIGKLKTQESFGILTSSIILASGLGTPKVPESVRKSLENEIVNSANPLRTPPQVMTFETVMRIIGQSPNPKAFFSGKRVAVVGVGDSANVFIEFLLGYAAEKGYGLSNGQISGPSKILWLGQDKKSCEDFIEDARSRYAQIGTGFRSSDPNGVAIIDPVAQKLRDVTFGRESTLILSLVNGRKKLEADYVILATGFEGELYKLFQNLYRESGLPPAVNDKILLEQFFTDILGTTKVSDGANTIIGREVKTIENGSLTENSDSRIVAVGPGAGKLPQDKELFGIIQNTVSIFNNALRTEATAQYLADKTKAQSARPEDIQVVIPVASGSSAIAVKKVMESRPLGSASSVYLEATLMNAFNYVKFNSEEPLKIIFAKDRRGIVISSNYKVENLIELLASTRDFFATLQSMLETNNGKPQAWTVSADLNASGYIAGTPTFQIKEAPTNFLNGKALIEIQNSQLPLVDIVP